MLFSELCVLIVLQTDSWFSTTHEYVDYIRACFCWTISCSFHSFRLLNKTCECSFNHEPPNTVSSKTDVSLLHWTHTPQPCFQSFPLSPSPSQTYDTPPACNHGNSRANATSVDLQQQQQTSSRFHIYLSNKIQQTPTDDSALNLCAGFSLCVPLFGSSLRSLWLFTFILFVYNSVDLLSADPDCCCCDPRWRSSCCWNFLFHYSTRPNKQLLNKKKSFISVSSDCSINRSTLFKATFIIKFFSELLMHQGRYHQSDLINWALEKRGGGLYLQEF